MSGAPSKPLVRHHRELIQPARPAVGWFGQITMSQSSSTHYMLSDGSWLSTGSSACGCNPDAAERPHACVTTLSSWAAINAPPGPPKVVNWVQVRAGTIAKLVEAKNRIGTQQDMEKIISSNSIS